MCHVFPLLKMKSNVLYSSIPTRTLKPAESASEIVILTTDSQRPGIQIKLLVVLTSTMHETGYAMQGHLSDGTFALLRTLCQ
jgi:hypothetical protein